LTFYECNSVKIDSVVSSRDSSKNWGHKNFKNKNHERVVFHPFVGTPPLGAIALNFGLRSDIADIITLAKLCDSQFNSFGVLIPLILPFFIVLAGRRLYNSVSITVLHSDIRVWCMQAIIYNRQLQPTNPDGKQLLVIL